MNPQIKHLQCLYAWADFYRQNQLYAQLDKVQEQITAYKFENGID